MDRRKRYWSQWHLCNHVNKRYNVSVAKSFFKLFSELHITAYFGIRSVLSLLLEKDADPDTKDSRGWTPLFYATTNGYKAVVKLSLKKGVDINAKDQNEMTSLHWAAREGRKAVAKLLLKKKPIPN